VRSTLRIGWCHHQAARSHPEDIKITLDLDPATNPIFVDRVQLETAMTNLANNATDAMPLVVD
jgi:nitrogen-specific signal transduction histidine kinase